MAGKVTTREKCGKCGGSFEEVVSRRANKPVLKMECPTCGTHPQSFFIDLYLPKRTYPDPRHRRLRISRDDRGHMFRSYDETNRVLDKIRTEMDTGIFVPENYIQSELQAFKGITLFPEWLESKKTKSPTHRESCERYVRLYFLPYFSEMDIRELKTWHVEKFYGWIQEEARGRKLSLKTQKNILTMLANFCRWIEYLDILSKLPKFPVVSPPDPIIEWITKEQQLKILEEIPDRHKPLFLFMFHHPVRPGEARALKVKDVVLDLNAVHICRAWSGKELRHRKNGKDYWLPLSKTFDRNLVKDKHPEAWLFSIANGGPYTRGWMQSVWRRASVRAGIRIPMKNATRHSIASQALNDGVRLETISAALGHSSLEMTRKRYARMEVESMREVVDGKVVTMTQVRQKGRRVEN